MKPRIKRQMILMVDADYDLDDLPDIVKEAIVKGHIQWPEDQMIGTKDYLGKRLLLISTVLTRGELTSWLNQAYPSTDENGEPVDVDLGLNWSILAAEGLKVANQNGLLNYMSDIVEYDEDGDIVDTYPQTNLESLQTYAGKGWKL